MGCYLLPCRFVSNDYSITIKTKYSFTVIKTCNNCVFKRFILGKRSTLSPHKEARLLSTSRIINLGTAHIFWETKKNEKSNKKIYYFKKKFTE
jgi:hypothetical protein